MRYAGSTLVAALASATATVAVALFSSYRLANAPIRGRLAGPDPIGSLATLLALAVGLFAFFRLGRSIATDAATARPAIVAGVIGGALAGLAGSGAQSAYLSAALAGYAVPPAFLAIALGAYVFVATCAAAVVASVLSYAGWHRAKRETEAIS